MCLTVDEVPATKGDGLVVSCLKEMCVRNNEWVTPFWRARPSVSGWLFPGRQRKHERFWRDEKIYGGVIHAFWSIGPEICLGQSAWAFGVEAYGQPWGNYYDADKPKNNIELVCRALWIPEHCTNLGLRSALLAKLKGWQPQRASQLHSLHKRMARAMQFYRGGR